MPWHILKIAWSGSSSHQEIGQEKNLEEKAAIFSSLVEIDMAFINLSFAIQSHEQMNGGPRGIHLKSIVY